MLLQTAEIEQLARRELKRERVRENIRRIAAESSAGGGVAAAAGIGVDVNGGA